MSGVVKPSEPLWALASNEGELYYWTLHHNEQCGITLRDVPCRVIPGHNKVVPLELVEAIKEEGKHIHGVLSEGHFVNAGEIVALLQAIDAALGGAL